MIESSLEISKQLSLNLIQKSEESFMSRLLLLSLLGFTIFIGGCGKNFDEYATELGLAFDSPDIGNRSIPSFKTDISPILTNHCALVGCHVADGPDGVDLRTYGTLQKGGGHGPLYLEGNAKESEIVEEVVKRKMPPDGPYLDANQIQLIIDWINAGAKDN